MFLWDSDPRGIRPGGSVIARRSAERRRNGAVHTRLPLLKIPTGLGRLRVRTLRILLIAGLSCQMPALSDPEHGGGQPVDR